MSGYGDVTTQVDHVDCGPMETAGSDGTARRAESLRRSGECDGSGNANDDSSFDNGCVDCHDFYEIHV